jgi:hypothetical protein
MLLANPSHLRNGTAGCSVILQRIWVQPIAFKEWNGWLFCDLTTDLGAYARSVCQMEFITPVQKLHSSSLNQMGFIKPIQKKMHFYEFGQLYGLSYPVYGGLGHLGNWAGARLCLIRSEIFLPFYDGSRIF